MNTDGGMTFKAVFMDSGFRPNDGGR
jgi:hypothetical protein